ncbi:uncharacterized protein OCT59_026897 [Rhizophagus irregularis]|nr:hypothetical protein OCT59_026897 [Rhizophagus irregularis]
MTATAFSNQHQYSHDSSLLIVLYGYPSSILPTSNTQSITLTNNLDTGNHIGNNYSINSRNAYTTQQQHHHQHQQQHHHHHQQQHHHHHQQHHHHHHHHQQQQHHHHHQHHYKSINFSNQSSNGSTMLVPLYDPSTIFTAKPTPTSTPTPTPVSTTISISQNSNTTSESTSPIKQTYSQLWI